MKIAITGTKRDLGKALAEYLQKQMITVYQYNREKPGDALDISTEAGRNNIALRCLDEKVNIFINNAYAWGDQNKMFIEIANTFMAENIPLLVVNMNSVNKHRIRFERLDQIQYTVNKDSLEKLGRKAVRLYQNLRVLDVEIPMSDTTYNKKKDGFKAAPEKIAEMIYKALLHSYDGFHRVILDPESDNIIFKENK